MPTYPPRVEPAKKNQQLERRLKEVQHAFRNNFSEDKVAKAVERYRLAKLALLKAKFHWAREMDFQKKPHEINFEVLNREIDSWTNKSVETIILELGEVNNK